MELDKELKFIFQEQLTHLGGLSRFDWIEKCLLGDIETFIHASLNKLNTSRSEKQIFGLGNLSIPILMSSLLDLISRLNAGNIKKENDPKDAIEFIKIYFPRFPNKIPRLLWLGVRNGLVHTFMPKRFDSKNKKPSKIDFQFVYGDLNSDNPIFLLKEISRRRYLVQFNIVELYNNLSEAVKEYKKNLKNNKDLLLNFVKSWEAIDQPIFVNEIKDKNIKLLLKKEINFVKDNLTDGLENPDIETGYTILSEAPPFSDLSKLNFSGENN